EDGGEDPEQPERVRQSVADHFDSVEGADDEREPLLLGGLCGSRGRFHDELLRVRADESGWLRSFRAGFATTRELHRSTRWCRMVARAGPAAAQAAMRVRVRAAPDSRRRGW